MAETGIVADIECVNVAGAYELVQLGLPQNLGNIYNANAPTGLTGDHTTLATAYTTTQVTGNANIIKPVRGFRMPEKVKSVFYYLLRVPLNGALTTGVTFELMLAMDPILGNADLGGTLSYFDVVGMKLQAAAAGALTASTTPDDFILSTTTCIAAQTTALPTVLGALYLHVIAVPKANLGTPVVGEWVLVRVRRLGDHQLDTNNGNLVLVAMSAYAY